MARSKPQPPADEQANNPKPDEPKPGEQSQDAATGQPQPPADEQAQGPQLCVMAQDAALGFGTRKRGTPIGTIELDDRGQRDLKTFSPDKDLDKAEVELLKANDHLIAVQS